MVGEGLEHCKNLFDPPSAEAACKVELNWFTPHDNFGLKYKYNHIDCLLRDLDSVISIVTLNKDASRLGLFILNKDDHIMLPYFF